MCICLTLFSSDYFVWDPFVSFFGTVLSGTLLSGNILLLGTVLSVHRFIQLRLTRMNNFMRSMANCIWGSEISQLKVCRELIRLLRVGSDL